MNINDHKAGAIILGHGSRALEAKKVLIEVSKMVQQACAIPIEPASLQLAKPSLSEAVDSLLNKGVKRIIVMPFFLFPGNHVIRDIPKVLAAEKAKHKQIEFLTTKQLGADPRLISVVISKLNETLGKFPEDRLFKLQHLSPQDIEILSNQYIEESMPGLKDGTEESEVKKRIIHATGDIGIAPDIFIAPGTVTKAATAIRAGQAVITDVNMVKAGINQKLLSDYKCPVICFIDDDVVRHEAAINSKTRAATAIKLAAKRYPNGIFAIGNAPSALFELCDLIDKDEIKPATVIGFPVGFIGAAEAKEKLMTLNVPWMTIKGSRGGSATAAAAINAVTKLATGFII